MLYRKDNVHGGDVYRDRIVLDYSVNTNPLGTPKTVRQAVRDAAACIDCYPDPYCSKLVHAIAEYERVPEAMVICGNGAAELIYSFCRAVSPVTAVIPAPAFAEYALALEGNACAIRRYFLQRETGFQLEEGILSFLAEERPQVLFLCNPNNPDGREISHSLLLRILQLCRELDIRVFLDECFTDLSDHRISAKDVLDQYPNMFLLKAFTKNYAMAGVRLGYGLCSDPGLLAQMSGVVQPWNVSVPAQAAGIAALQDRENIQRAREIIPVQREWLSGKLQELGFLVIPSEANYILFQGPNGLEKALRGKGIAIRDCANYPGLGEGWYRIAVKLEEENRKLIDILRDL